LKAGGNDVRTLQGTRVVQQTATRHGLDWNSAFDATTLYDTTSQPDLVVAT
jgi:hypothetical protein